MSVAFRRATPSDFPEVRRITREAYLKACHFAADHPYMAVLGNMEHRAGQAQHARQLPGIAAISITSATFMERAHGLYQSLGFKRAQERDWYVPGEDLLLWVFTLQLGN